MKKLGFAFMTLVSGLAGCDQAPQPYQQSYNQPSGYEQPDARVVDAAQRSRSTAMASMKYTLPSRDTSKFDCDADDDINPDNLSGDGDADCVVYRFGRQDQYECPSNVVGSCKPDSKRTAKPVGYVWGYHAKPTSNNHSYTPAKPSATPSHPAKPLVRAAQPTSGFFGNGTTQSGKQTTPPKTPPQPKTGFFSGGSTKSTPSKSAASKPSTSTKSKEK